MSNGKGSRPRSYFNKEARDTFDAINWHRKPPLDELYEKIYKEIHEFVVKNKEQPKFLHLGEEELKILQCPLQFVLTPIGFKLVFAGLEIIEAKQAHLIRVE